MPSCKQVNSVGVLLDGGILITLSKILVPIVCKSARGIGIQRRQTNSTDNGGQRRTEKSSFSVFNVIFYKIDGVMLLNGAVEQDV